MCAIIKGEPVPSLANSWWNPGDPRGLTDLRAYPGQERGLPALVNEVDGQGADNEDTQAGDEHVVDGPEVLHLHQFTGGRAPWMSVRKGPQGHVDWLRHRTHVRMEPTDWKV